MGTICWKPYSELHITPEMENQRILLYVEQVKLCSRKIPEVITADIIDGKVAVCSEHNLQETDWNLSEITHYALLDHPSQSSMKDAETIRHLIGNPLFALETNLLSVKRRVLPTSVSWTSIHEEMALQETEEIFSSMERSIERIKKVLHGLDRNETEKVQ